MNNRKRLWSIFGPVLLACVLVIIVIALPWGNHHSAKTEERASVSLSPLVMKNSSLKTQALSEKHPRYVAFFGSSEFRRMDRYHPAVMAQRYHNYRPFIFGSKGTQSLPQLFNIAEMNPELKNKKAVFVISPQWFVKQGVTAQAFKYYNGAYANLNWLSQANPRSPYDRYTAKRLVQLLGNNGTVGASATKISQGKSLSSWEKFQMRTQLMVLRHEDSMFAGISMAANSNYSRRIKPKVKKLPKVYNYAKLTSSAKRDAKRQTTNNRFGLFNGFYDKQVRHHLKGQRDAQRHFNYEKSPEYADLEVVLNQFKKDNTNVMFVITPVNAKWEKYTGLSMPMYYKTANKIKYQLKSQGFNNVVDYSHKGNQPGFMQDTIHIGWAGWVNFDHHVGPFLDNKQPAPQYKMNTKFLSKHWQKLNPTKKNLQEFNNDYIQH